MKFSVLLSLIACVSCSSGPGPVVPETRTERQMLGLLEKFDRWDYDGNGELSQKEVQAGINGLKGKPQQVNYTSASVMEFYDADKNGGISLREAQAGYKRADEVGKTLER
jgi:hypothetical protein